jgi:lipopolysaccharide export system protein LptA
MASPSLSSVFTVTFLRMIRAFSIACTLLVLSSLGISTAFASSSNKDTQIESQKLEMIGEENRTVFLFTGSVKVTATNLTVTCDQLEVQTKKEGEGEYSFGQIGPILSINASKNVEIRQAGRIATADNALLLPDEGRIVLTGNPIVRDRQGEVSGERIILLRNQRRAIVEGGEEGSRTRVRLGQIPDLGFQESGSAEDKDKKAAPTESSPSSESPAASQQP